MSISHDRRRIRFEHLIRDNFGNKWFTISELSDIDTYKNYSVFEASQLLRGFCERKVYNKLSYWRVIPVEELPNRY